MKKELAIETRSVNVNFSTGTSDGKEESRAIEGVIPYNSKSEQTYLGYTGEAEYEVITPTAFNKTLGDKAQVLLNYNHNSDNILGSTKSGTLVLTNTADGLHFRCELPKTDIGTRALETIKRGDCNTLSFEYYPREFEIKDGVSYVKSAQLEAISCCVPEPAYTQTYSNVSMRSICERAIKTLEEGNMENNEEEFNDIKSLSKKLTDYIEKREENSTDVKPVENKEAPKAEEKTSAVENQQLKDTEKENTDSNTKAKEELLTELQKELQAEIES